MDTFERFVRDFEGKINQLKLVEMGVKVVKDIDSTLFSAPNILKVDLGICVLHRPTNTFELPYVSPFSH